MNGGTTMTLIGTITNLTKVNYKGIICRIATIDNNEYYLLLAAMTDHSKFINTQLQVSYGIYQITSKSNRLLHTTSAKKLSPKEVCELLI